MLTQFNKFGPLSENFSPLVSKLITGLVIITLGSFFNCCNFMCTFFVKTGLLRLLSHMHGTTLPRIRSASLGVMPHNPSGTASRKAFTGTSLGK